MKKKVTVLIIILAAALVMVGAFFVISSVIKEKEKSESTEELIFAASGIAEIQLDYNGEQMRFIKRSGVWSYADDENFPLNKAFLRDMEAKLISVKTSGTIKTEDYHEYGLDKIDCSVKAVSEENTEFAFSLGNVNETANAVYALIDGKVHILEKGYSTVFRHSLIEMSERNKFADIQPSDVQRLLLTNENGETELCRISDETELEWKVNGVYADTEKVNDFISSLSGLTSEENVSYRPDDRVKERYGLLPPTATVEMTTSKGSFKFETGKELDGLTACFSENTGLIGLYASEIPEKLGEANADYFVNTRLYPYAYDEAAELTLETEGKKYTLDLSDYDACWDFYYKLSSIRAEGFADEMPEGSYCKLTVKAGAETREYTFVKFSPDFYAVKAFDGIMLINRRDTEELINIAEANK